MPCPLLGRAGYPAGDHGLRGCGIVSEHYRADYDIVFMDIELPGINGMEAAHRLREIDQQVILIFVTNMAQFAVKGYEVDALDYIIKPAQYGPLSIKLTVRPSAGAPPPRA